MNTVQFEHGEHGKGKFFIDENGEAIGFLACSCVMRRELLLVAVASLVAGCATVGPISTPPYFPSNPSAVLLRNKGDIQTTAIASAGGETVTGAYALTPHFGVLASGAATLHKSGDPSGDQYSGVVGCGVFDTEAVRGHTYCELYGGLGWGAARASVNSYELMTLAAILNIEYQEISGEEERYFASAWIQGAAGYSKDNFSLMAILRIESIDIYQDLTNGQARTFDPIADDNAPFHDTTFSTRGAQWTLTPGLEARYGLDHVQLIAEVFGWVMTRELPEANFQSLVSVGIAYKF